MMCEVCEEFVCKVCGHEACPVCEDCCDHQECLEYEKPGSTSLVKTHTCVFPPCPNGCVRRFAETTDSEDCTENGGPPTAT